jgi:hypothetical protein
MSTLKRRLDALEQRKQAARGIVFFQQDMDDSTVFYAHGGPFPASDRPYSREEIDVLAAQGWQIITLVYEERDIDAAATIDITIPNSYG